MFFTEQQIHPLESMKPRRHEHFCKQLKKLIKKFRSLEEDLLVADKNAIKLYHEMNIDNNSIERVPGLKKGDIEIFKIKKFASRSLKGKGVQSGTRIIYARSIASGDIEYLEIYYKEKDNTDMNYDFVKEYLKS